MIKFQTCDCGREYASTHHMKICPVCQDHIDKEKNKKKAAADAAASKKSRKNFYKTVQFDRL